MQDTIDTSFIWSCYYPLKNCRRAPVFKYVCFFIKRRRYFTNLRTTFRSYEELIDHWPSAGLFETFPLQRQYSILHKFVKKKPRNNNEPTLGNNSFRTSKISCEQNSLWCWTGKFQRDINFQRTLSLKRLKSWLMFCP